MRSRVVELDGRCEPVEPGNREGDRDPMVAVGRDSCLARRAAAHPPAVRQLLHLRADGSQPGDHRGDAVRLLDPQLRGVADLGASSRTPWPSRAAAARRSAPPPRRRRSTRTAAASRRERDMSPTGSGRSTPVTRVSISRPFVQQVDQRQPRRVQANVDHRQLRIGVQGRSDQPGRAADGSPGTVESNGLGRAGPVSGRHAPSRWIGTPMRPASARCGRGSGRAYSIDGLALGAQAGQDCRAQQLRAGTGSRWSVGRSVARPTTVSGAWPSVVVTSAPSRAQQRRRRAPSAGRAATRRRRA